MLNLGCLFLAYCGDSGVGPIFLSLCRNWQSEALSAVMIVPNAAESYRGADLVEAIPRQLKWLAYRRERWTHRLTERKLLGTLARFDAVYAFPNISLAAIRHIQKSGRPVVIERINCCAGKARDILEPEYKLLGVRPQKAFHAWDVEPERTQIEVADFHFAPSPEVEKSLLEISLPPEKIIVTSYGWSPDRFPDAANPRELRESPTILFVGYLCVRKGVHLLLRAWERAGIRGRLVLCGRVEPAMAQLLAEAQKKIGRSSSSAYAEGRTALSGCRHLRVSEFGGRRSAGDIRSDGARFGSGDIADGRRRHRPERSGRCGYPAARYGCMGGGIAAVRPLAGITQWIRRRGTIAR